MTLLMSRRLRTVSTYDSDISSSRTARLLSLSSSRAGQAPAPVLRFFPDRLPLWCVSDPTLGSHCNSSINKYNDSTHAYDIVHVYSSLAGRSARLDLYTIRGIPGIRYQYEMS